MDVNRIRHELWRDESIDNLLHDNGVDDRDDANERADEDTRDARKRTAKPWTDNRNDVEHTSNKTECGSTG